MRINEGKKIVVYCSSRGDLPEEIIRGARLIGETIGKTGASLVYGGVNAGLMHVVAEAVANAGAEVIGVVPSIFGHRRDEVCHKIIETQDLNDRKGKMISLGDAFVVLPGGIGTIDEWISTLSHILAAERCDSSANRLIYVWNHEGMYDTIINALQQSDDSIFGQGRRASRSLVFSSAEDLCAALTDE